jgi:hypothetical protein
MVKTIITLLLIIISLSSIAQINGIFPLAAKRGMQTGAISLNGQYAFVSNASYPMASINLSIYDVQSRRPVKNIQINLDPSLETWDISNDGHYILMDDSDGYGYSWVFDINTNKVSERHPNSDVSKIVVGNQNIHELFFPDDNYLDHWEYWFSNHYALRAEKKEISIYDSLTKQTKKYDLNIFEGLNNPDKNDLCLSENGNLMAYTSKAGIHVFDLEQQRQIFNKELNVSRIVDLSLNAKGVLCLLGYFESDKSIGLHWYDIHSEQFVDHSTEDGLLNLSYVSQFHKFMTVGMGKTDKKKVEQIQTVDLSSGDFSAIVHGKGWSSFDNVQKFVKDTLSKSLLTDDEFNHGNSSRVYYTYGEMRSDYFNKDEQYLPQPSSPQVNEEFFKFIDKKDWQIQVLTAHELFKILQEI